MKRKIIYLGLTLFCLMTAYSIQRWVSFERDVIKQNIENERYNNVQVENLNFNCDSPSDQGVKNIKSNEATIYWEDNLGANWEYIIQFPSDPFPTGSGISSSTRETKVTQDQNGNLLQPSTEYEFYVRTNCGSDGYSSWLGPYNFKTLCGVSLPFIETFNSDSGSFDCWYIIDQNNDAIKWTRYISSWGGTYEGTGAMQFFSNDYSGTKQNDDWLISPEINLTGAIYQITYYYHSNTRNLEFEVLLSQQGVDIDKFTTVLQPAEVHTEGIYKKKVIYVQGITGEVNIAWHIITTGTTQMYLDLVSIEEVECFAPENVKISNIKHDEVKIEIEDNINSSWEYYVVAAGSTAPVGSGVISTTKESTINRVSGAGTPLQQNTGYDVYVRSSCGNDKYGKWVGPYSFTTTCAPTGIPFHEGFNTSSPTVSCWRMQGVSNTDFWTQNPDAFEGDHSMALTTYNTTSEKDEWLISPPIRMDASKLYRLSYNYQTSGNYADEFSVLASDTGSAPSDFDKIIVASKKYSTYYTWKEKQVTISGLGGVVYFAWHATSNFATEIYIDNINIEEITCPEPTDLSATNDKRTETTLSWEDSYAGSWEYVLQPAHTGLPTASGISTTNKQVVVNSTATGNALQPDTEYEFYVRSVCGNNNKGEWVGPFTFSTACDVFTPPFWEGFNSNSTTFACWREIDVNGNANIPHFKNTWSQWNLGPNHKPFEGDMYMLYTVSQDILNGDNFIQDSYFVSPTFNLDAAKTYRLRYHLQTFGTATSTTEFEIVASNKGIKPEYFDKVLAPHKQYDVYPWTEYKLYISGIGGEVNIAWHASGQNHNTTLELDNVFLEEVEGCIEPLELQADNIETDQVTISWQDLYGDKDWEYRVQKRGRGIPVGNGKLTSANTHLITQDYLGDNLEANTEYEFYVRTVCGAGEYSIWSGPFVFTTACGVFTVPFHERFGLGSQTLRCWTILDENNDGYNNRGTFGQYSMAFVAGWSMRFEGSGIHDDWLISPLVKLDPAKQYRLKYHYSAPKTHGTSGTTLENRFRVMLSNSDTDPNSFTHTLIPFSSYANSGPNPAWITNGSPISWSEEKTFISGIGGEVYIGWHIKTDTWTDTEIFIDNVIIEEVEGCPEPSDLDIKDIEGEEVTLFWQDNYGGTSWEYYIQKEGEGLPVGNGTQTNNKENTVDKDQSGKKLIHNKNYEYYVRTVCNDGEFSIWSGPFQFKTACEGVLTLPFWEGFNTDSETFGCWTILDVGNNATMWNDNIWVRDQFSSFEGDRNMKFNNSYGVQPDGWLISPALQMTAGQYMLRFHFKADDRNPLYNHELEILLSNNGVDVSKFTTVISPKKSYGSNDKWQEEIVFFNGIPGNVNIAWRASTGSDQYVRINIDNVFLKKVQNCKEPYYAEITGYTPTSMEVEWKQDDGITEWEVIVVEFGEDETAVPVQTLNVTGTPKTTISGLDSGKGYTVYVRAKCKDGKSYSDWGVPVHGGTSIINDECSTAIRLPVNNGIDCEKFVSASLLGSTKSLVYPDFFGGMEGCNPARWRGLANDVWFEFTATSDKHLLNINNFRSPSGQFLDYVVWAVYEGGTCPTSAYTASFLRCGQFEREPIRHRTGLMEGLIPGNTYYVRIGMEYTSINVVKQDYLFDICISTIGYLDITPQGETHTPEEMVKEIFVKSDCDLVSNVKHKAASGVFVNTLGYFKKNNSDFPFEEGIVLSTADVDYLPGPYVERSPYVDYGKVPAWEGDSDINDVIINVGGAGFGRDKYVSTLEFDFIPIKDSIQFEYLFASESYHTNCVYKCTEGGALFAAWLVELETGEGENLALVPGTSEPIALSTIKDSSKSGVLCESVNPEFYWKHYGNNQDDPLKSAISLVGLTKAMQSEKVHVNPGKKYRIKFAIADFCSTASHSSAVFFNAMSFDLGDLDLGPDLLVDTNNAICAGDTAIIKSGLVDTEEFSFSWYKDGEEMVGENKADLEVNEAGEYSVEAIIKAYGANCEVRGSVKVEIYPKISTYVNQPKAISTCSRSLKPVEIDLTQVEDEMFGNTRSLYIVDYFEKEEDAIVNENVIEYPNQYGIQLQGSELKLFIRVENKETGCYEIFDLNIQPQEGIKPNKPENVNVCAEYIFPDFEENQYYYSEPDAAGIEYHTGDVIDLPGEHIIYVIQVNNDEGCYEEISYKINITAPVVADIFENETPSCEYYKLKPLSESNNYYPEPGGKGDKLYVGEQIFESKTIYVYASSEDGLCTDESSFTIDYEDCPIPRGISPNNDGLNDVFDLTPHGVESIKIYNRWGTEVYSHGAGYTTQWHGQSKNGKQLPDGTYYYVIHAHGKIRTGWVQINK
ncbi:choice-of-anchor J domain-containing protein [Myroides indicus]|uniref:Cleaved adhesin domain-containing protein n=1 Tax=Myroides indicus TaxID=1323422 RepID=A0A4R7EUZ9_9FLAO|nr:choice-of-anchor J domain-containing protein [Myroides indicus]TDS50959.1 cleaved adhesin domain-containing protein [Myroides indicus]